MKQQRNMFQMKEKDKTPEEELRKVEISNSPDKEFKVLIIKMLNNLGRKMDEHSDKFNKELENTKMNQRDLKNIKTGIKDTLEGIYSRLNDTE